LAPIAHPETLKAALTAALGVRAVVEKRREIFLHHNVRIHLDDVLHLGSFLEFEAELGPASDEAAGRALIESLMRDFAIAPADLLPGSYAEMLLQKPPLAAGELQSRGLVHFSAERRCRGS